MGAKNSTLNEGASADMIELFFLKAGKTRQLRAGERFIREGELVGSVFLVTEGECVLKKREKEASSVAKQIGTRSKGALLGELSFLLGMKASVSVEAGSGPAVVIELPQSELARILQSDPQLAGGFFRLLGATLAERITEISGVMKKAVVHGSHGTQNRGPRHAAAMTIMPASLDMPQREVAIFFELPPETEMLLHCECFVTIEENSVVDGQVHNGKLYLFETHVCFDFSVFHFTNIRRWAISDVLAVRLADASGEDIGARATIEVQCRSLSLSITLPLSSEALTARVASELEAARVNAMDISKLQEPSATHGGNDEQFFQAHVVQHGLQQNALAASGAPATEGGPRKRRGGSVWGAEWEVVQLMQGVSLDKEDPGGASRHSSPDTAGHGSTAGTPGRASAPEPGASLKEDAGSGIGSELAMLSQEQWTTFLAGADSLRFAKGETVINEGDSQRALYQVISGSVRIELKVKGRPQAVVVGHLQSGRLFGERSLLLGGSAAASVVVESADAVLLRLRADFLHEVFVAHPELMGKFFCLLAVDQAKRLSKLTKDTSEEAKELVLPEGLHAPTDMHSLLSNPAYLTIVTRYVRAFSSQQQQQAPASPPNASMRNGARGAGKSMASKQTAIGSSTKPAIEGELLMTQLEFVTELTSVKQEPDPAVLHQLVAQTFATFLGRDARKSVGDSCLPSGAVLALEQDVNVNAATMPPAKVRALFDEVEQAVIKAIEEACLQSFLASTHYNYVLSLILKTQVVPSIEQFKAIKVLGEGGFGQVLEVVKRDCGKVYAMKVMKKSEIMSAFAGEDWKEIVLLEKQLHASMHHPLVVNLAYSFQNAGYLVLVMDTCPGGDLSVFCIGNERLTPPQVRFVGQEVTCVLAYLHSVGILYRDLKPENLLLDAAGHVRLIDFGLALSGGGGIPTSDELCGTPCYMAPEVLHSGKKGVKKYSAPADWFTLGVLLYEMSEKELPFGEEPRFSDFKSEFRKPKLLTETGKKNDQLLDLIKGLLDWKPEKRLGGGKHMNTPAAAEEVKAHKYWKEPEWGLVELARLPSPLVSYVEARLHTKPTEHKLKKQQRAAVETAVRMAAVEKSSKAARSDSKTMTEKERRARALKLDQEDEMNLDAWNFVSRHAIEAEYVETIASSVSLL